MPYRGKGMPRGPSKAKNGGLLNLNPFNKTQSHINKTQRRMIVRQSSEAVQQFRVVTGDPSRYDHRVSLFTPLGSFGYYNQVIAEEHSFLVGLAAAAGRQQKRMVFNYY